MSQFTDILSGDDGVYSLTGRPDLVSESKLAVRQATLAAHRCDFFRKDLVEQLITPGLGNPQSNYSLDLSSFFLRWRAFAYIRPYNSVTQSVSNIMIGPNQFIAPDSILDPYNVEWANVAYVAGNNVNIKLEAAYDSFLTGHYVNPVLLPEGNYNSWIAAEQPAVIVLDASMRVLSAIGYDSAAAQLKELLYGKGGDAHNVVGGEYMLLKQNALEAGGR